jgi:uncharacterized membrane protein YbaN (DUF454 family)
MARVRPVYFLLGWCFFGLGAVGTVVPGLPTTPFMLLALWGFARSSRRFHDWLFNHRLFGPPLQQWQAHGVISRRVKLMSVTVMTLSLGYVLLFTTTPFWLLLLTALFMLVGATFILSRPSRAPDMTGTATPGKG